MSFVVVSNPNGPSHKVANGMEYNNALGFQIKSTSSEKEF